MATENKDRNERLKRNAIDNIFPVHAALRAIIDASNANPSPIHYKVKEAIDKARELFQS